MFRAIATTLVVLLAVGLVVALRGFAKSPRAVPVAEAPAAVGPPSSPPPPLPSRAAGAPPPRPATPAAVTRDAGSPPDEAAVMARLRELGGSDPALTLRLAREDNARFPDSPDAPERTWYMVKALVDLARFDEAVAEAKAMVKKYPDNERARDVERHLLSNPLR